MSFIKTLAKRLATSLAKKKKEKKQAETSEMTKHYETNEKKKNRNVAHIYISKILKIIYIKEHYF